jgi:hypothetical protein
MSILSNMDETVNPTALLVSLKVGGWMSRYATPTTPTLQIGTP